MIVCPSEDAKSGDKEDTSPVFGKGEIVNQALAVKDMPTSVMLWLSEEVLACPRGDAFPVLEGTPDSVMVDRVSETEIPTSLSLWSTEEELPDHKGDGLPVLDGKAESVIVGRLSTLEL